MLENTELKIKSFKDKIEKAKTTKTVLETNLLNLKEQETKCVEDMAKLGVTPDTIESQISALEKDISEKIIQLENSLKEIEGLI